MVPSIKEKDPKTKEIVKQKLRERKKLSKNALKEKRARLIVKNLPFKVTEANLKEHFEKYGEVDNVELLKKPDGKLIGCGFIQFKLVQKAAKARHHTNEKQFMGRQINVDFVKAKDKYKKEEKNELIEIKEEPIDVDAIKVEKEEPIDVDEVKVENEVDKDEQDNSDKEDISTSDDEDSELNADAEVRKPHVISNDVNEGKTVFVKNIPFQATNADLKECMLQFGRVYYALVCVDKLTEHSKGTGFVKFLNKEDADKALSAGTELTLLGNILDCHPALGRNEVNKKAQDKKDLKKEPKDSRNLYLVKEGVILAGTKAAESVSASDMAKRLQIEQYKTQMLRNLNMFVSRERLVVHNLPPTWDDKKVRTLFEKFGGPGAIVREARIMRDMKDIDANGIGKSKEYGFVGFTRHENALAALRNLNNNPDIFSPGKRPIITFSIENKKMVNARLKRLEKSKVNNPTNKRFTSENKKWKNDRVSKKNRVEANGENANEGSKFTGVTAKPGMIQKMRSRYKLQTQAKLHYENLKKEKKKQKNSKKTLSQKKQDFIKQPKQKINKKKNGERDNFSQLVNDYKRKLVSASTSKPKNKWYA